MVWGERGKNPVVVITLIMHKYTFSKIHKYTHAKKVSGDGWMGHVRSTLLFSLFLVIIIIICFVRRHRHFLSASLFENLLSAPAPAPHLTAFSF